MAKPKRRASAARPVARKPIVSSKAAIITKAKASLPAAPKK